MKLTGEIVREREYKSSVRYQISSVCTWQLKDQAGMADKHVNPKVAAESEVPLTAVLCLPT